MGLVAHTCNPGTQEDEPGGLLQIQCQPVLQGENPSQKKKKVFCVYIYFKTNLLSKLTFMPLIIFYEMFKNCTSQHDWGGGGGVAGTQWWLETGFSE